MKREWVYQTLTGSTEIADIFGDRVFQGESLDGPPKTKPFVIYRLGNTSPDNDLPSARRQYLTIYIHDNAKPGDYTMIDQGVDTVVDLFRHAPQAPEYNIICAKWLETSADFDDREMGTILRYVRFQIILSKW